MSLTKQNKISLILNSLIPMVETIGQTFGKNCEVVLHDFRDPQHSIIKIVNGHVSGRSVGGPITDFALATWRRGGFGDQREDRIINYKTKTKDGKVIKSSTVFIKDEEEKIVGCLCINYEMTFHLMFSKIMNEFCHMTELGKSEEKLKEEETFATEIDEVFEKITKKAIEQVGKPVSLMQKNDKLRVVKIVDDNGGFIIKGAIDRLANELSVSRYTIYNYLAEL